MKLSDIQFFLNGEVKFNEFKNKILEEVAYYKKQMHKRGSSAPINIVEDTKIIISNKHIKVLCEAYLSKEIDNYELCYIADALLISAINGEGNIVSFEGEHLMEKFESLVENEISLTPKIVIDILDE
jgi:hypothetical protein